MGRTRGRPAALGETRSRPRWVRVRVETQDGSYVGRVRVRAAGEPLRDLLDGAPAYLALWDVLHEPSGAAEGFVAIDKGAIRFVVLIDNPREGLGTGAGA